MPRIKILMRLGTAFNIETNKMIVFTSNKLVQLGKNARITKAKVKFSRDRRREAGKVLVKLTKQRPAKIDRVVNARGAGVRFIKRGGRIIPIRGK
jgi:hypothetical protein